MPIIKFHVPELPSDAQALEKLRTVVHEACVEGLRAQPDAVQLMVLPGTTVLFGQPGYIEVLYRDQDYRRGEVMERFMRLLESQTEAVFGFTPRIRCMAIQQTLLHALN